MRRIGLFVFSTLLLITSIYSQENNWRLINPNWDNNLYGFASQDFDDFPFVTTQWAATDNGIILRSRDDWNTFEPVKIGGTNEKITKVKWEFVDSSHSRLVAVGEKGTIVVSTDNGKSWEIKSTTTTNNLNDVEIKYCTADENFYSWAVGDASTILYSHNGGQSWNQQSTPYQFDNLVGVSFLNSNRGLVVGTNGIVYQTTTGGEMWVYKDSHTLTNFNDVVYHDSGFVAAAVGESGKIYRSHDAGTTWAQASSQATSNLRSVVFSDSGGYAVGDNGTILESPDSGLTWHQIETSTTVDFNEVYADRGGALWAVGDSGTICTNTPAIINGPDTTSFILHEGKKGFTVLWDSSSNAIDYHVGKREDPDTNIILDPFEYRYAGSTGSSSIVNDNAEENTSYTYIIQSYDGTSYSLFSKPATVNYGLHPPENFKIDKYDSGGVHMRWDNVSENNTKNTVFRKEHGMDETFRELVIVPPDTSSYLDNSVEEGKTYTWKVKAYGEISESAFSDSGMITIPTQPIQAPSNLRITNTTNNAIDISWDGITTPHEGYIVSRKSENEDALNAIDSSGTEITTYRDTGLEEGTKYTYRVQSYSGSKVSSYSDSDSGYTKLNPPSNLQASFEEGFGGRVSLTWDNNSDKLETINLLRRGPTGNLLNSVADADTTFQLLAELPKDATTYLDSTVEFNSVYYYKLNVVNDNVESNFGNIVEVSTAITEITGESIPTEYRLYQNYPNPFNPKTNIKYQIPKRAFVSIKVYNVLGKEVIKLISREMNPGYYNVVFDGSNLSTGVYLYKIETADFIDTKKLILLK